MSAVSLFCYYRIVKGLYWYIFFEKRVEGSDFDYGEKEERTRSFRSNAKAEKEYPFFENNK